MSKRILYIDANAGISGDMAVAAMLDLGADPEEVMKVLKAMPIDGYRIEISRVKKAGLDACDFNVILEDGTENHDHDMEYLHGHEHDHGHEHEHGHGYQHDHIHEHDHGYQHDHGHDHDHGHSHDYDHPAHSHGLLHEHRTYGDICHLLSHADMSDNVRSKARKVFSILAAAEAKAHGLPADQVHFHEVGAVDSIVDITAACVCLDDLKVDEVVLSPLSDGHGTIRCQHGIIPVPVPAVANIAAAEGLFLRSIDVEGELVTPTGAAFAAAARTRDKLPETYRILKTGFGAGKRCYSRPSLLRMMLLEAVEEEPYSGGKGQLAAEAAVDETRKQVSAETIADETWKQVSAEALADETRRQVSTDAMAGETRIIKLESDIDDANGEMLALAAEHLREAGAREVNYCPVYMKKNRPGWQLNVICMEEDRKKLEHIIFAETTTIGIRRIPFDRTVMERSFEKVSTPWGMITVKVCTHEDIIKAYPEYEEIKSICERMGASYEQVYHEAVSAWQQTHRQ